MITIPSPSQTVKSQVEIPRGWVIMREIWEYPLSAEPGTKDYVFYAVSQNDNYGLEARFFHDIFYKNHEKHTITTLEDIIQILYNQVTNNQVNRIREIVIVCHGTAQELKFTVTDLALTDDLEKEKYQFVKADSLSKLQADFASGNYTTFKSQRQTVISRLSRKSWITIRACNFGYSKEGMFAMYAFWGGRANVYAPKAYQAFIRHPLFSGHAGLRFNNFEDQYQHFLKQRIFKKEIKRIKSRHAILREFYEAGRSSVEFSIVTFQRTHIDPNNPPPLEAGEVLEGEYVYSGEWQLYKDFTNSLKNHQTHPTFLTRFQANQMTLSNNHKVNIESDFGDRLTHLWVIEDVLTEDNVDYYVQYLIGHTENKVDENTSNFELRAYGNLPDVFESNHSFPYQTFFSEDQHDRYKALVDIISDYDMDDMQIGEDQAYAAKIQALQAGDLATAFTGVNLNLDPGASITPIANAEMPSWQLTNAGKIYLIQDQTRRVPTEHVQKRLVIYEQNDAFERYSLLSELGADLDAPGTELMAFFDQLSTTDIVHYINYTRLTYGPLDAYYIHHALQALARKGPDYANLVKEVFDNANSTGNSALQLSEVEKKDRANMVYEFEVNLYWAQAREGSTIPFNDDLYEEYNLGYVQPPPAEEPQALSPSDTTKARPISQLPAGIQKFFEEEREKRIPHEVNVLTCAKFKELLDMIVNRGNKTIGQLIEEQRDWQVTPANTLETYLTGNYGINTLKFAFQVIKLFEDYTGSGIPGWLGRIARSRMYFAGSTVMAIYTPLAMVYKIASQQAEIRDQWEKRGIAVGWATAAREVQLLMFQYGDNYDYDQMPAAIDVESTAPGYEQAYTNFMFGYPLQISDRLFGWDEAFEKGYLAGLEQGNAMAGDTYRKAEDMVMRLLGNFGLQPCMILEMFNSGLVKKNTMIAWTMIQFGVHLNHEARNFYWEAKN